MIKLKDILNEAMSDAEIKKMHQKYKDTGELPPHLKKMLKGKKDFEKKFKVKNIVVPGLEWMSKIKEDLQLGKVYTDKDRPPFQVKEESVNEAPEHDLARDLNKISDMIIKVSDRYKKKADVEGMVRSWMMGLHAKLKKSGVKV